MKKLKTLALVALCTVTVQSFGAPPPLLQRVTVSNNVKSVTFSLSSAIDQYLIQSTDDLSRPFTNDGSALLRGNSFLLTNNSPQAFFKVGATPISSNRLLSVNLLNRIAYGPTPDELVRLDAIGPQAYLNEQLNFEGILDDYDVYTVQRTNGVPATGEPVWREIVVTGTLSSSNLYVYLTQPGVAYIDDISLSMVDSNGVVGPNLLQNGGFENTLLLPWVTTANTVNSSASTEYARSGSRSLRLVCNAAGSTQNNSLWQGFVTNGVVGNRVQLSFWYLEADNTSTIHIRLANSGVAASGNDAPPDPEWIYATVTGIATSTRTLYLYLSGAGDCYIDDIKLVAGSVPEAGPNLLRNGDFEADLHTNNWNFTQNFTNSFISRQFSRSGGASLKLIATAAGSGNGNAMFQTNIPGIANNGTYTLSFWYTAPSRSRTITARLSGSSTIGLLNATFPDGTPGSLRRRLDSLGQQSFESGAITARDFGGATLADLRAWHVLNAVGSKQQLLQVLLQFLENHFVTQHGKSVDYFDRYYDEGTLMDVLATNWEFREIMKWRNALLNPNCNFYDLLRISAESPAMIVYLDSVDSNGSGNNIANENYAREIMELFAMGVDNGYDQQDITVMSRSWSGWSVDIVDPWEIDNPHAARTTRVGFYPGAGSSARSNLVGVWTFNYKSAQHGTNRAPVWCVWNTNAANPRPIDVKRVPARFGPPWANAPYNLYPTNAVPVRTGTNGIQDGYDVLAKIADLPFTMEYISVKLCRLFVHDDFVHGEYDYTDPNRSPEAELIRQCMVAWDTPVDGRKGNIRAVLNTIFSSELFRSHGGSLQKVKTPVEFAVSTIRALRGSDANGGHFASTDGYSISGRSRTSSSAPLTRMGSMMLFDRDSPDGYPEAAAPWISAGTLAERIRFVQTTLMNTSESAKADGISGGNFNRTDPVGLLKSRLPSNTWSDAGAVADFFLGLLFPGEGRANLDGYKTLAVNFLNTADNGTTSSPFNTLGNTSANYDTRVRAMVAMLMTLPRFQEQ